MYCIQHCFICRPSDSTVSEDTGIKPRTVATSALAVRRSNHYRLDLIHKVRSHPQLPLITFELWEPWNKHIALNHWSHQLIFKHRRKVASWCLKHSTVIDLGIHLIPNPLRGPVHPPSLYTHLSTLFLLSIVSIQWIFTCLGCGGGGGAGGGGD